MIDRLKTLSRKALWLRPVSLVVAVSAVAWFSYTVLLGQGSEGDTGLIPSVVLLIWALAGYAMVVTFPFVPDTPSASDGRWARFKVRTVRAVYHLMAWLLLVLTLVGAWLSLRLVNIWLSGL
ncbi:hypothetical protein [Ferrimonas marina]|uniref:Uncharacterized protein n=1 Tax=Ferrimonas marina TaxID=299255 RepID=A0A1M5NN06_9GAMM|nr:hypothetical protein [Ferrimonas marina]SHG90926.1 hypothetical protein SAMN02745129_1119 [Ferrimonas marina]